MGLDWLKLRLVSAMRFQTSRMVHTPLLLRECPGCPEPRQLTKWKLDTRLRDFLRESHQVMNQHIGRSELDSIIDSFPDADPTRLTIRTAVARWGPDIVLAFRHIDRKRLTSGRSGRTMRTLDMTQSHSNEERGTMSQMLSPVFMSTPLSGQWAGRSDIPEMFAQEVESFAKHWRAPGTLARLATSWNKILRLCLEANACPLPMDVGTAIGVISHIASSGVSFGDVRAAQGTIAFVHKYLEVPDPTKHVHFQAIFAGIKRELGARPICRKLALTRAEVGEMIRIANRRGRPDHAVALAVGYEGALRVNELCALQVDDVLPIGNRVRLYIRRSKSDQNGVGAQVDLELRENAPFDASDMTFRWLNRLGRKKGYLLSPLRAHGVSKAPLDARTFSRMVKFYAACIGLDARSVASHSMRAGWITEEIDLGRPDQQIAAHARHSSVDMLIQYYRSRKRPVNFVSYASAGSL